MGRRVHDDEEWEKWSDDTADDSSDDFDSNGGAAEDDELMPCPYCKKSIHDESQQCPYCQAYLTSEDRLGNPRPWWVWVGLICCLAMAIAWIFL